MNSRTVAIFTRVFNLAASNGIAALLSLATSLIGQREVRADPEGLPSSAGNAARRYS